MTTQDALRNSGRTTRLILNYVEALLESPGQYFIPVDHDSSLTANKNVLDKISEILSLLHVDHIKDHRQIMVFPKEHND